MQNRCTHCGGELKYDISSKQLKCIHCDSLFNPESFESKTNVEEYNDIDMTIYTCPTCGVQISSTENAAVDYCLYCGSFVSLNKEMSKVKKPDYIIPFSKTHDECKEAYKNMIKRKLYAPKEFRDESFIEGFKGIYIPYWTYEYTYGPTVTVPGQTSERHGNYIHKQTYTTTVEVKDGLKEIAFDASSSFDDDMSKKIIPFDYKNRKPFNEAYMFGFFGDTADVKEETYTKEAKDVVTEEIWADITSAKEVQDGHPVKPDSIDKIANKLNLEKKVSLTMLPVWFLTWKKDNRIAYSAVNGDNGKIYSEIPVSLTRYLLISFLTAIPIFFLLNFIVTFNASDMLLISILLSALMILLYSVQLNSIVKRYMHVDDKGYLSIFEEGKQPDIKSSLLMELFSFIAENVKESVVMFGLIAIIAFAYFAQVYIVSIILFALVLPLYTLWCIYRQAKLIEEPNVVFDILGAYVTFIISGIIWFIDPAADRIYYIAAILCILGIALSALQIMRRYNDMITRPMPHFFNRKAGNE